MHCSQFSIVRAVKISRNLVMAVKKKGTSAHKESAQIKKTLFYEVSEPEEKKCFSFVSSRFIFFLVTRTWHFSFVWWLFFGYTSRWAAVSGSNHGDDGDTIVITLRGRVSFLYILQPFSSHQRCKMVLLCSRMDGKRLTTNFQFFPL